MGDENRILLASQAKTIAKLRSENEKMKAELSELQTACSDPSQAQKLLQAKKTECLQLEQKIRALESVEEAHKQSEKAWEEKERDLKLMIESFQSAMKDQRQLVEVQASEKKLKQQQQSLQEEIEGL